MGTFQKAVQSYPIVFITLIVGIIGLGLLATPFAGITPWLVGGFALLIALFETVGMIRQIVQKNFGLDILAITAITAAVVVGEYWAALIVVLMLTGGEALEDYAENRSKRELTALLNRAPENATLVLGSGASEQHEIIAVTDITVGDTILVRPGEVVPVDATLLEEFATFDEASMTGESLPVEHAAGDMIASGVVNGHSAVRIQAIATAANSQYQQIIKLVQEAQESKAPTVRLADRYAIPFTLVSLLIAGIAWFVSGDPVRFAEVLVVATPCPLLIAAPVAFLGGMSRAARAGLIVKSGGTLEQLSKIRSVAFDKTGTLTTGKPLPQRIEPQPGFTEDFLLQLAASAEVYSSHVLASAVISSAQERELQRFPVNTAEENATNGVSAEMQIPVASLASLPGNPHSSQGTEHTVATVRVGKPTWIESFTSDMKRAVVDPGELAIYVSVDDRYAGAIIMRDNLREDAAGAIENLQNLGIERMLMLTGDIAATAEPLAHSLGITEVHAECLPADKVRIAQTVQPRPLLVAGDGLNDAPVLAAADVGFAMGAHGATAASESADVVNRFDRISGVADAVRIGHDTVRIALQSIWAGIIISVGLMIVAAFGYLPAIAGALLQEVVDLVAILGALRALGSRKKP